MYICPITKQKLIQSNRVFKSGETSGTEYPIIGSKHNVVSFASAELSAASNYTNEQMYDMDDSVVKYKNFLNWLLKTFKTDDISFRSSLIKDLDLKAGNKVLITGCGLGDDVDAILLKVGKVGIVCAQDLSEHMVLSAAQNKFADNLFYSISNAESLPYEDSYFDAVFHFGGINLFSSIGKAISEMDRVIKTGGKIVFGDEGLAPWLKDTEYGKIVINNNSLWAANAPLELLSPSAKDVKVEWVLGNCFYLISYSKSSSSPDIDMNVEHIGPRGGTMKKRFFGQLEGVDDVYKNFVDSQAGKKGVSKSQFLELIIDHYMKDRN